MAVYAYNLFRKNVKLIDLKDISLPFCDGDKCYEEPIVKELKEYITKADSIIISSPIYNYDLNAAAKNLIELTGRSWTDKLVGMIVAAGGKSSYMSPISFMNILMLDFRCIIIPRFVYADKECFRGSEISSEKIKNKIQELVDQSLKLSKALS
tara:strand:+ start:1258 stop:1716 length:459 start_codon:yes stop_codon:yes gene_type:complete